MEELIKVLQETNTLLSEFFHDNTMEFLALAVSVVAAIAAVYVPWKISNRQDKVALFEKRFEAYSDLLKLKSFANSMADDSSSFAKESLCEGGGPLYHEMVQRTTTTLLNFGVIFGYLPKEFGKLETLQAVISRIRAVEVSVNALPLLYGETLPKAKEEVQREITNIFGSLLLLMTELALQDGEIEDQNRVDFVQRTRAFVEEYEEIFEDGLKL